MFAQMRLLLLTIAGVLLVAGCGHRRRSASDCYAYWNNGGNAVRQSKVAGRFTTAEVSNWRAQAGGTGNLGGRASVGCSYLFHTRKRFVSFSGQLLNGRLSWGIPGTLRGAWSPQQQASVRDNASVDADGRLHARKT
jgi:hypothetical protein